MININLAYRYDDYTYLKINCYASYILNYSHLYAPSCGAIALSVVGHEISTNGLVVMTNLNVMNYLFVTNNLCIVMEAHVGAMFFVS
jgi:hypothetical protein